MKLGALLAQPELKMILVIWIIPETSKYQVSQDCSQFYLISEMCEELDIGNHPTTTHEHHHRLSLSHTRSSFEEKLL